MQEWKTKRPETRTGAGLIDNYRQTCTQCGMSKNGQDCSGGLLSRAKAARLGRTSASQNASTTETFVLNDDAERQNYYKIGKVIAPVCPDMGYLLERAYLAHQKNINLRRTSKRIAGSSSGGFASVVTITDVDVVGISSAWENLLTV